MSDLQCSHCSRWFAATEGYITQGDAVSCLEKECMDKEFGAIRRAMGIIRAHAQLEGFPVEHREALRARIQRAGWN